MNEEYICINCGFIHNAKEKCISQKNVSEEELKQQKERKLIILIKDELKGTFNSIFEFNSINEALMKCLNEYNNLLENIFNYITKYYYEKMRVERYNENFELVVEERKYYPFSNLVYQEFCSLFDTLFYKTLEEVKRINTIYAKIEKEKEKENIKREKENQKQECIEVYNLIFEDMYALMEKYKRKRRGIFESLSTNKNLEIAWDSIETFLTFEEFAKIYHKVLAQIKVIFKEDISYKRDIKNAGLLGLFIYATKHMKKARKY